MLKARQANTNDDRKVYFGRTRDISERPGNIAYRERCYSMCESYKSCSSEKERREVVNKLLEDFIDNGFKFFDENGNQMDPSNNGIKQKIISKTSKTITNKIRQEAISLASKGRNASDGLDAQLGMKGKVAVLDGGGSSNPTPPESQHEFDRLRLDLHENTSCLDDLRDTKRQRGPEKPPTSFANKVKASRDRDGQSPIGRG